jgi:hypothetical protein
MKTEDWIKKNNPYKRAKEPYGRGRKDGWKEGAKAMAEYLNNNLEEDIRRIDKLIKETKEMQKLV